MVLQSFVGHIRKKPGFYRARRVEYLKYAIEQISSVKEDKITLAAITILHNIAVAVGIPSELVEEVTIKTVDGLEEKTRYDLYLAIAGIYLFFYRYDNAFIKCEKALEINPGAVAGIITKGQILITKGQYAEGLVWLKKAIKIDRRNVRALINIGYTFDRLREYKESITMTRH
jgi:tetratricopeptide (TPR) repeat protein